ncbi:MAG: CDP-alcohol phosphatidyltransferase family protein [Gammaproteobacteria bacterium]|nr:CDP-alcohol phosphatidyltransferase family protein [Gammaproteobacteria bacterium]
MASIYDIKPAFQNLLRPITQRLAEKGVTANQVTIATLILSLIVGLALTAAGQHKAVFLLVPVVMLVRMALNAIDGMLAREHNMKSPLGAILNELCDVIEGVHGSERSRAMYDDPCVAVEAGRFDGVGAQA